MAMPPVSPDAPSVLKSPDRLTVPEAVIAMVSATAAPCVVTSPSVTLPAASMSNSASGVAAPTAPLMMIWPVPASRSI